MIEDPGAVSSSSETALATDTRSPPRSDPSEPLVKTLVGRGGRRSSRVAAAMLENGDRGRARPGWRLQLAMCLNCVVWFLQISARARSCLSIVARGVLTVWVWSRHEGGQPSDQSPDQTTVCSSTRLYAKIAKHVETFVSLAMLKHCHVINPSHCKFILQIDEARYQTAYLRAPNHSAAVRPEPRLLYNKSLLKPWWGLKIRTSSISRRRRSSASRRLARRRLAANNTCPAGREHNREASFETDFWK